jgi:hypothetical protein
MQPITTVFRFPTHHKSSRPHLDSRDRLSPSSSESAHSDTPTTPPDTSAFKISIPSMADVSHNARSGDSMPGQAARASPQDPLVALLGPGFTTWTHSDESLIQALNLRAEMERTKQEYYRLEIWHRSLELLREATAYNVPPSSVPVLFQSTATAFDHHQTAAAAAAAASAAGAVGSDIPSSTASGGGGVSKPKLSVPHDRERFPTHQRNMSLPPQPLTEQSKRGPPPPPPPPPINAPTFRPSHQHHVSMSALPVYGSPGRYSSSSSSTASRAWQTSQPYFPPPPPVPPSTMSNTSPSSPSSSLQVLTFHHWQPNQGKPSGTASPPKKEVGPEESGAKRRRSSIPDRPTSPTQRPSPAITAALAHSSSRKRGMGHARHRSEASILRGDSSIRPWLGGSRFPEESSGVNVLASVATAEDIREEEGRSRSSPRESQSKSQSQSRPTSPRDVNIEERPRKHDVDFMIQGTS